MAFLGLSQQFITTILSQFFLIFLHCVPMSRKNLFTLCEAVELQTKQEQADKQVEDQFESDG